MKKNYDFNNEDFLKLDYKNTHLLKKFINENGKIIPQRVLNTPRAVQTRLSKAIKQARYLSLL
ncbi:MAG: 30S ribosomal protein S18 [Pelagibacteraceae bacterium]|nr:30S ribosomal protein S18 [Pelagibacteraceae bacterium]|tara:strand:- start:694 stop:882 length:189 start_codon:yes stop_codon:yes gene_type:complete